MLFLQNNTIKTTQKHWIILLILISAIHTLVFTQETAVLKKVLPSIVIIDSERITYNSPYKQDILNNLLYPFDFDSFNTSPNGNGITHKNIFGSGTIIKKIGSKKIGSKKNASTYYILSNNHVVEKSSGLWITTYDGYIHKGTLLGADIERDIALISFVSETDYPLIAIGDYTTLEVGMHTYAIGSPYGFTHTVTEGIISSLDKTDSSLKNLFIQTDASMNPGNSGGALINKNGALLGVSTWIYSPKGSSSIGINFASSINIAMQVVENILAGKKDDHSWIGITYSAYAPSILHKMDIDYRFGAIVTNIIKNFPAEQAGVKIGDVITLVNKQTVKSFNKNLTNTSALISTLDSNEEIEITITRQKKNFPLSITPIEAPLLQTQDALKKISLDIWPGMTVLPLEDYKQEILGLETKAFALYVEKVIPHTPAHLSGINGNDVIVKINNKAIKQYQDYIDIINDYKSDKNVVFTIFENGILIEKTLATQTK